MKKKRPQFFALYKEFNGGAVKPYEVLHIVFNEMFDDKENIDLKRFVLYDKHFNPIPVRTKKQLLEFTKQSLMSMFWGRAEWELIAIDWPYISDSISESRPVKIDVWRQLEPNLEHINDLIWNYSKRKINALVKKEKKDE